MFRTVALAAVIGLSLFSTAAYARDPVFTARLAAPVSEQTRVIAGNTLWNCAGDTCLARSDEGANVHACRQFVREAGSQVSAYGTETDRLSEDELARCNAYAPQTQTQQARN